MEKAESKARSNRMKFEFYGEKTPFCNGFTQPVITKECTFEDALRYLENGDVFDDESSRGLKIVEFKQV
ncbi:hypothetical protein OUY40_12670 [Lactococcus cremoris]|uniref:hypothetical protein n=1 Tax=Lactococcus lactis subsp. cremoris TaxID=1359 RepID=UPI0022B6E4BA|nr:hypothetical protein [Lactococcus cremoris]MCZ7690093.1 hypothetical protein [Lactococcus cremoris]